MSTQNKSSITRREFMNNISIASAGAVVAAGHHSMLNHLKYIVCI